MLCACSGEQFKLEDLPQSPESLATRDFSASGISSRTGTADWEAKVEDARIDEVESTLREALSLNYEEARALLGRLEYQRGRCDAALQVFQGININALIPRMVSSIMWRTRHKKHRFKGDNLPVGVMSMHSVSLLLEAILLKARSLEGLGHYVEAAKECKAIADVVDSALPEGMPEGIAEDCKLQEMFHEALELLPIFCTTAGLLDEAITAYRRALIKPWNLDPQRLARLQKDLAVALLYGGVEASNPTQLLVVGPTAPESNTEEAILLLLLLMRKMAFGDINWDTEIMDHLTYALSVTGQFELLALHVEQVLPGIYHRVERWYYLALCYTAAGQNETSLNLLRKVCCASETNNKFSFPSFLLGAKLCSQDLKHSRDGIIFARKAIDSDDCHTRHFSAQVHKYLGICYGNLARTSVQDSERVELQKESLCSLNHAVIRGKDDPEILYSLALENAVQRNLDAAFDSALAYSDKIAGSSKSVWKLLTLILSAQQRFDDAERIVDFALEEAGRLDQLELLRLKAVLQITQEQPKQAIESYRILLSLIQAQREIQLKNSDMPKPQNSEASLTRNLEATAWRDLAALYIKLGLQMDAEICIDKSKSIDFFSPGSWHATGLVFEAQSLYREALASYAFSLSIEPDYVRSIVSMAKVLMKFGSSALPVARSFFMNALRLDPTNHDTWLNLGLLSRTEGLLQQAADFFQAAHELELSSPVDGFV